MNIYWWSSRDGTKNLGDEITPHIVSRLTDLDVKKSGLHEADVIGAGSILGWVYESKSKLLIDRSKILYVFGSGFMRPQTDVVHKEYLDFFSVRGYLSQNLLGKEVSKDLRVGDPGILVSDIVDIKKINKKYKYGIIPHMGTFNNKKTMNELISLEDSICIDFRADDVDGVVDLMLQCEVIISQSLHGLIFADSLLFPNAWLTMGDLHPGGNFKFYDYFSTVNRPFWKKCTSCPIDKDEVSQNLHYPDEQIISGLKFEVREALNDFVKRFDGQ